MSKNGYINAIDYKKGMTGILSFLVDRCKGKEKKKFHYFRYIPISLENADLVGHIWNKPETRNCFGAAPGERVECYRHYD